MHYEGGIASFVEYLNRGTVGVHPVIFLSGDRSYEQSTGDGIVTTDVHIEVALQYNDGYNESVYSFANNVNTIEGGAHLTGFRNALTRGLNKWIVGSHEREGSGHRHRRGRARGSRGGRLA